MQVHVGPPMTIQYKDFLLKTLPDDLPLIKHEAGRHPARRPQGRTAGPGQAQEAEYGVSPRRVIEEEAVAEEESRDA